MKILIFTPYFPPNVGGLETLLGEFVGELAGRGHAVDVIASSEPGDLPAHDAWRGATVHRLALHTPLARNDVRRISTVRTQLAALKRELRPDVLHVHLADAAVLFHLLTAHDCDAPTIVTVHSSIAASEARPGTALHAALVAADVVTGCSRSMLDQVLTAVPEIAHRARVILNGVDSRRINPASSRAGPPCVLIVGRMVDNKGFDVGLRACTELVGEFPRLRVVLVGDGPERAALTRLVTELGITHMVEITGAAPLEEVAGYYARASVVAVPSRYPEPFGLVVVEAGLAGLPVVASAAGALPEVVDDGVTGLLVRPDDPSALADGLRTVLRDPVLAAHFGAAGRARALQEFSLARFTDQFEQLYRELAG